MNTFEIMLAFALIGLCACFIYSRKLRHYLRKNHQHIYERFYFKFKPLKILQYVVNYFYILYFVMRDYKKIEDPQIRHIADGAFYSHLLLFIFSILLMIYKYIES